MSGHGDSPSVRLLLDQNIAPRLARRLADLYPASAYVRDFGLAAADDAAIWTLAAKDRYAIVTKDDDFRQRSFLLGAPPKVVWVRLGNGRTADIERVLRARYADVLAFAADAQAALARARAARVIAAIAPTTAPAPLSPRAAARA